MPERLLDPDSDDRFRQPFKNSLSRILSSLSYANRLEEMLNSVAAPPFPEMARVRLADPGLHIAAAVKSLEQQHRDMVRKVQDNSIGSVMRAMKSLSAVADQYARSAEKWVDLPALSDTARDQELLRAIAGEVAFPDLGAAKSLTEALTGSLGLKNIVDQLERDQAEFARRFRDPILAKNYLDESYADADIADPAFAEELATLVERVPHADSIVDRLEAIRQEIRKIEHPEWRARIGQYVQQFFINLLVAMVVLLLPHSETITDMGTRLQQRIDETSTSLRREIQAVRADLQRSAWHSLAPDFGIVVTKSTPLNIRAGAGRRHAAVGTLPSGTVVAIVDRANRDWWKISQVVTDGTDPIEGWAYARYIQRVLRP